MRLSVAQLYSLLSPRARNVYINPDSGVPEDQGDGLDPVDAEAAMRLKKAAAAGNAVEVHSLIQDRVDVDQRFARGLTALHFAALNNRTDVVRTLLYCEANTEAESLDEGQVTPLNIAEAEGHEEVMQLLRDQPPAPGPYLRRYLGPSAILALLLLNASLGLFLARAEWQLSLGAPAPTAIDVHDVPLWKMGVALGLAALCGASLVLVCILDPGTVQRREVAYVHHLRGLPETELALMSPEHFAFLHDGYRADHYRWCRSCELWRPRNVSHCAECRRCFWRFDHHCHAVGNCIGARNHRFFALMLLSGAAAWMLAVIEIGRRLERHHLLSDFTFEALPRWQYVLALLYIAAGLAGSLLIGFGGAVHAVFLVFNINTKMYLRPKEDDVKRVWNTPGELAQLCLMPLALREFGDKGGPRPLPPTCLDPPTSTWPGDLVHGMVSRGSGL